MSDIRRPTEDDALSNIRTAEMLRQVVGLLSPAERIYFLLSAITGFNTHELAKELGVTHQAIQHAIGKENEKVKTALLDQDMALDLAELGFWID